MEYKMNRARWTEVQRARFFRDTGMGGGDRPISRPLRDGAYVQGRLPGKIRRFQPQHVVVLLGKGQPRRVKGVMEGLDFGKGVPGGDPEGLRQEGQGPVPGPEGLLTAGPGAGALSASSRRKPASSSQAIWAKGLAHLHQSR